MKNFFSRIIGGKNYEDFPEELTDEYVEIDTSAGKTGKTKIIVRPFVIQDFGDIKPILDSLREGMTVALINIKPLKERDIIELKRAVSKLKKTCEAIDGDIAGFGEDWVVVTPSFAQVHRTGSDIVSE
ncbi:cell division protein SepF [Candidatus Woesearchaeota archaeon]|nr:cell division protein SepF [Candidatus Woesearchaeota archaeon]